MKIILKQDFPNVGEVGDVQNVAHGYARNFLIPRKIAVLYNKENATILQQQQRRISAHKEVKRKENSVLKDRLAETSLLIEMEAGEKGRLFGAVTNTSIVDALKAQGIALDKKKILIPGHSIKVVGRYTLSVKLHGNLSVPLEVTVKAKEKEE